MLGRGFDSRRLHCLEKSCCNQRVKSLLQQLFYLIISHIVLKSHCLISSAIYWPIFKTLHLIMQCFYYILIIDNLNNFRIITYIWHHTLLIQYFFLPKIKHIIHNKSLHTVPTTIIVLINI